jgi:hypothetical protein
MFCQQSPLRFRLLTPQVLAIRVLILFLVVLVIIAMIIAMPVAVTAVGTAAGTVVAAMMRGTITMATAMILMAMTKIIPVMAVVTKATIKTTPARNR